MVTASLGDLGLSYEMENAVNKALKLGTSGNLIKRYKEIKVIETGRHRLSLDYSLAKGLVWGTGGRQGDAVQHRACKSFGGENKRRDGLHRPCAGANRLMLI